MKKTVLVAVLDANVLYSAAMRDCFMRLATRFVFQPKREVCGLPRTAERLQNRAEEL